MKKIKYPSNLVSGIASIIAGIVLWFVVPQQVGLEKTISYGITSRSVPTAIAVLFVVGGVILVLQSLVFKKEKWLELDLTAELRPLIMMIAMLAYISVFKKEWPLATAALGCLSLALSRCKKWYYYVIVIAFTLGLYFLFVEVLHIRLKSIIL